jgi:hypothetical protein
MKIIGLFISITGLIILGDGIVNCLNNYHLVRYCFIEPAMDLGLFYYSLLLIASIFFKHKQWARMLFIALWVIAGIVGTIGQILLHTHITFPGFLQMCYPLAIVNFLTDRFLLLVVSSPLFTFWFIAQGLLAVILPFTMTISIYRGEKRGN